MQTIPLSEWLRQLNAQGVERHHLAFICPMCATVQSAQDLIEAGAGGDFEAVEKYVAFSCVGRWTGAGAPRKAPDGMPCNWTLGGLFQLHKLAVINDAGVPQPAFEPASPEAAQAHAARSKAAA